MNNAQYKSQDLYVHWTKLATTGTAPTGRYAHTMASVGNRIFVFGGCVGSYDDDKLYVLNTVSMQWDCPIVTGQQPTGRGFHSCAVVGTDIYYFGGFNGRTNFNDIIVLDTKKMAWVHPIVHGTLPPARFEQQLTAVGDYLFLLGGGSTFGHQYLNAVHVFDTESLTWGVAPIVGKPPKGRCAHSFTAIDKTLYVYGGFDGKKRLKDTRIFSAETATWMPSKTVKSKPPGKRAAHVACASGRNIFVHGGYDGKKRLGDVCVFNTETREWIEPVVTGEVPSPRSYHTACNIDKSIYFFGGYDGTTRSSEVFILEKVMPSLVNLCASYIVRNKDSVGNVSMLPSELKDVLKLHEMRLKSK